MRTSLMALSALLTAVALPAPSNAQDSNSVRVSYADLNLTSGEGRGALERRIFEAAKVACGIEDSRELALWSPTRECRRDAVSRAQPAFDAAVAAARGGSVTVIGAASIIVSDH